MSKRRQINLTQASRILRETFGETEARSAVSNLSDLAKPGARFEQEGMTVERPDYTTAVLLYEDELLEFWPKYLATTRPGRPKGKKSET